MKILKRVLIVFVAFMTLGSFSQIGLATAESNELDKPLSSNPPPLDLSIGTGSTLNNMSLLSTQYLMSGSSMIQVVNSTRLKVSGNTKAYTPVDKITVDLYLEQWDSSSSKWKTVLSIGETSNFYSTIVSTGKEVQVVKSYYYRLRANHRVVKAGKSETKTSVTGYVYAK
ncbi:DUF6147 family protein [Bacillus sp. FSL K6-3431]|uniref:DUF6147 family protein n=1 Tax=Bacillus sp. FSL K6-3431 TaxID=2921500 RepID=UPI0030F9C9CA